jgi:hypothetical protein
VGSNVNFNTSLGPVLLPLFFSFLQEEIKKITRMAGRKDSLIKLVLAETKRGTKKLFFIS